MLYMQAGKSITSIVMAATESKSMWGLMHNFILAFDYAVGGGWHIIWHGIPSMAQNHRTAARGFILSHT